LHKIKEYRHANGAILSGFDGIVAGLFLAQNGTNR
jgi:hypothetical protein